MTDTKRKLFDSRGCLMPGVTQADIDARSYDRETEEIEERARDMVEALGPEAVKAFERWTNDERRTRACEALVWAREYRLRTAFNMETSGTLHLLATLPDDVRARLLLDGKSIP